jgi:hypothetical protein
VDIRQCFPFCLVGDRQQGACSASELSILLMAQRMERSCLCMSNIYNFADHHGQIRVSFRPDPHVFSLPGHDGKHKGCPASHTLQSNPLIIPCRACHARYSWSLLRAWAAFRPPFSTCPWCASPPPAAAEPSNRQRRVLTTRTRPRAAHAARPAHATPHPVAPTRRRSAARRGADPKPGPPPVHARPLTRGGGIVRSGTMW